MKERRGEPGAAALFAKKRVGQASSKVSSGICEKSTKIKEKKGEKKPDGGRRLSSPDKEGRSGG